MKAYEATIDIQAPAERIWPVLSAVESWPRWLPTVVNVEPLGDVPLQVGRRYRVTQPKLQPTVWTVSAIDAGRRFEWRSRMPGLELVADHAIGETGPGTARVRLQFEFRGWLGALLALLYGALTRDYLGREAQALKDRVEARRVGAGT
jgi:uncharacterized membrane protein